MHHRFVFFVLLLALSLSSPVDSASLNQRNRKQRDDPVVPVDYWLKQQLRTHMSSTDSVSSNVPAVKKVALPPGLKPASKIVGLPPGINLRPATSIGSAPSPSSIPGTPAPEIAVVTDAPEEELSPTTEAPTTSSTTETARVPEVPADLPPAQTSGANNAPSRPTVKIPVTGGRRTLQLPQVGRTFTFAVSNILENRERTKEEGAQKSNSGVVKSVVQSHVKNVTLEDTPSADSSSGKPKINRIVTTAEDVTQNEHVDISFGPVAERQKRQLGLGNGLGLQLPFLQSPIEFSENLGVQASVSGFKPNGVVPSELSDAPSLQKASAAGSSTKVGRTGVDAARSTDSERNVRRSPSASSSRV
uniref:Uncharacterized protein n=1 Tax=Plectus sambesii TaxID=2011161 RepID=A0A914WLA6_9BILA